MSIISPDEMRSSECMLDSMLHTIETVAKEQGMPKEICKEFRATQIKLNNWMETKGIDISKDETSTEWV